MLENIKTIYFDYDGTLHDSMKIYEPAFKKAYNYLVETNNAEPREWRNEEISKWLGYSSIEMWQNFMKNLDISIKKQASSIIGEEMFNQIQSGNAELYPNSVRTLSELKQRGYKLIFLSNCRLNYMEISREMFNLDKYFDDMYCAESFDFIPKELVLSKIKSKYPDKQLIVGDRFHDIESGLKNNISSIWCTYGFGSVKEARGSIISINDISELLAYLK